MGKHLAGWAVALGVAAACGLGWSGPALGEPGAAGPVEFNQHEIEAAWRAHGVMTAEDEALAARSAASRPAGPGEEAGGAVDFEDPRSVLRHILSRCPGVAVVYPTETYYYYRFELDGRRIAGNVRLLDAGTGRLHMGYFDRDDRTRLRAATFAAADGVMVTTVSEDARAAEYLVEMEGRGVRFVLPRRALARPEGLRLLESEAFISGILDESGVALCLLFNGATSNFYYVLNPAIAPAEELRGIEGSGAAWSLGSRTGFVYYADAKYGRRLLVGVSADNVMENNYGDGPFDQVPPRLALREKLELAYPYVKYRGGIDEHGNFLELKDQRVAISPYQAYHDLGALMEALEKIDRESLVASERWLRMTMEAKQGYDPVAAASAAGAPRYLVQGWPANHWGDNSRAWPEEHRVPGSAAWPANHQGPVSAGEVRARAAEAGGEAGAEAGEEGR